MVEDRLKNKENFNISMANQILQILNTLNKNILILNGVLKDRGFFEEEKEKDNKKDRMEEDTTANQDNSENLKDRSHMKDKDLSVEDLQRIKDAIETIQDLEKKVVEQAKEM